MGRDSKVIGAVVIRLRLVGLMAVNRDVLAQAEMHDGADHVVLDMDSSESPVHGQQEGGAYNGHFESVCYHPLFLFNDEGDCLAAPGCPRNVEHVVPPALLRSALRVSSWTRKLAPAARNDIARCWSEGDRRKGDWASGRGQVGGSAL